MLRVPQRESHGQTLTVFCYPEARCSLEELNGEKSSAEWEEKEQGRGITDGIGGQGIGRLLENTMVSSKG